MDAGLIVSYWCDPASRTVGGVPLAALSVDCERFSLAGMSALVTGASGGIGSEIALSLARSGADLVLTGRKKAGRPATLTKLSEQIRVIGRSANVVFCDFAEAQQIQRLAQTALSALGHIDILLNVAGVVFPKPALQQTLEEWDATVSIDLRAPFLLSQALAPSMIAQASGSITMVSSAAGIVGFAQRAAYAAAKGGLMALVRQLAVEWGPHNIRLNGIAPTVTMTSMAEAAWSDAQERHAMFAKIPVGRFAQPADVAGAAVFLASQAAGMISGQVLAVDEGYTIQ